MAKILRQHCFNHPDRDAAARCPECGRFYCRECVTEHRDRVLCATCLKQESEAAAPNTRKKASPAGLAISVFQLIAGLFFLWVFFHFIGQLLLRVPSEFHEGGMWSDGQ
ncbi:MAG: rhomboid family protein [Lentisphaeria bacterium]|nr:rhomboid family protein [Lentisphaeria bacterium]